MAWKQPKIIMKIPITLSYDQKNIIGEAKINDDNADLKKLLESGNYTFRAGFEILEQDGKEIKKAKLVEISLIALPEKYGYKDKKKK